MMDLQEAFDAGFEAVKAFVERSFDAYDARLAEIEQRFAALPTPKEPDFGEVHRLAGEVAALKTLFSAIPPAPVLPDIGALVNEAVDKRLPGNMEQVIEDGASVTVEDIAAMIADEVAKAIAALPPAKDGEPGKDADPAIIKRMVEDAVAAIPRPENGKDADMDEVRARVAEIEQRALAAVSEAVAGIKPAKDGTSVTIDDVRPMIEEQVAKAVSAIPVPENGKDGVSLAGAMQDKDGNLHISLSNGTLVNVGRVRGDDGTSVDLDVVRRQIKEMVDAIPKPKDGSDGKDGIGFDDMDLVETDKGVMLRFVKGDKVKEFRLPVVRDCGVYKEGSTYLPGDGATWGGSFWICQEETTAKPDSGKGWRLAVKKGRDGKDMKEPVKI